MSKNPTSPRVSGPDRLDYLRIRHLRFILLISSLGSLAAASEALAITASAASMMLKEIEQLVGARLFLRAGRGMVPTAYGAMLLPRCRTLLGEVGAMRSTMSVPVAPLLRLGVIPHTAATVLPAFVEALALGTPNWRLHLHEGNVDHLVQMLLDGETDLVIGRIPRPLPPPEILTKITQRPLYQSALSIVGGLKHWKARSATMKLADLQDSQWILPAEDSMTRVALVEAFLMAGLTPPVPIVESPSVFYSLSIAARTQLLTCCPQPVALAYRASTRILPVELNVEPSPVTVIWRKSSVVACEAMAQLDRSQLLSART